MAHRDDTGAGPGANDNASGTAALLELARTYARPQSETQTAVQPVHTLVFLSTDAGAFGGLGALRFARARRRERPRRRRRSTSTRSPGPGRRASSSPATARAPRATGLVQTASRRIAEQTGEQAEHPGVVAQLIDLGFPFTFYEQGPFVARGIPAITLTTSGSRPAASFGDSAGRLHVRKLAQLGRSAQETLGSLDGGLELAQGTTSYVWFGQRIVRGWAIELVLIALLVPVLRRQRRPLRPLPAPARRARRRCAVAAHAAALLALRRARFHVFFRARRLAGRARRGRRTPNRPPRATGTCSR